MVSNRRAPMFAWKAISSNPRGPPARLVRGAEEPAGAGVPPCEREGRPARPGQGRDVTAVPSELATDSQFDLHPIRRAGTAPESRRQPPSTIVP